MKSIHVKYNFSDDFAMLPEWHICGQRYLSLLFRIAKSLRAADEVRLETIANRLSLDGELCVDLFHTGDYQQVDDLLICGYIFRDSEISPNAHRLESLSEEEITKISILLEREEELLSFSATEQVSKDERGQSTKLRMFKKNRAQSGPHAGLS